MKVNWTLRYERSVTAFLYSIRGTEKAAKLSEAIKAFQYKDDPTEGCIIVEERPARYEFEAAGHWVGIRVLVDDKTVSALYITIEG